ncbi:MAG: Tol-Pal system protein TolQ [Chlamydiia bacterium]|nr:Tol-Pal system protein TolQ [Chlamydiia bacterium]MCH9616300.1 Tol-Pal system protein TolQ [Chlamydiia bacterium]MCH9629714.1 Tol-Pal system protein TolQ [Chlamydiia bacterium]
MITTTHTFINAFFGADSFGKLIFLMLFALSIIAWFFLIHKAWVLKEVRKYSGAFQDIIEKQSEEVLSLSPETLPKMTNREVPHPFAHIYLTLKNKTVEILDKNNSYGNVDNYLSHSDIELLESHLNTSIVKQRENLEKNLFVLPTTVTLAPFLGLLGTVWGIMVTFSGLQSGGSITSNSVVLGGLSTALATTVLGLLIAIPALVGFNIIKNSSKQFLSEMHDFAHELLSTVEMQYRKVDVK